MRTRINQGLLNEIRTHLADYLNGKRSLKQFRRWFDVETWGVAAESDSPTRRLAGEIDPRIAEYTNGHRTEDDLHSMLQPLLQREPASKR